MSPEPKKFHIVGKLLTMLICLLLLSGQSLAQGRPSGLLIGIEPEHNIFTQMESYRKLAEYLSERAGIPVRLTVMSRYGEVLERFKKLHLDGALLDSHTATLAIDAMGMAPIVRPVNLAGNTSSHGLIFTRRDSGIKEIRDMHGKSFAFVDPATTEGYIFPMAYLRKNSITNPLTYLGHNFFTGSHASAISAILDGRADLGAAKDEAYSRQIARDPSISKELVIISRSEPLPPTTLFLRCDLAPELKKDLTDILLGMAGNIKGREILQSIGAQRFTRAEEKDYDIVRKMTTEAGLNRGRGKTQ
ncbi:MAG: phosphate/phosphite/phosphonate ABC transporter substrate-binding protein [Desulfobulbaceae bacterium]|nr:phosphate/phosphite/phosphonate ABC transporter substrate-binding protein [Desulfobulbaceae bacterium]